MPDVFGYCIDCAFYAKLFNNNGRCHRNCVINPQIKTYKAFNIKTINRVISRDVNHDLVEYCRNNKGRIIISNENPR